MENKVIDVENVVKLNQMGILYKIIKQFCNDKVILFVGVCSRDGNFLI